MNKMTITEFFENYYVDQASYDNLRKIANYIDGLKNASRKVIYTSSEKNIKSKIKVSQLNSKTAEFAEYLHGDLSETIVNISRTFVGTNNEPLLMKSGNFGTRFEPAAAAPRYIYVYSNEAFTDIFNKEDNDILVNQYFEGEKIEPMFYVPNLPMILINGSEGVSSGYAQKILPRNKDDIKKYIQTSLNEKRSNYKFTPSYNGFKGEIVQGETSRQWLIKGVVERKGVNKVLITEVPVGLSLKKYTKTLDDLEEKGVIQSYKDLCEKDSFKYEVNIPSKVLKTWDDNKLLEKLKLVKTVSENYTVMDEFNKVVVMKSAKDLIHAYMDVKLRYMCKRKDNQLKKLQSKIDYDKSKYEFIKLIVNDKLIINKRKKADIVKDLEKYDNILKKDDTYDYLLSMNILFLSEERMKKLADDIVQAKTEYDVLNKTSEKDLWLKEL